MSSLKQESKKQYTEIELEVLNAFLISHAGFSADRVILADPELNAAFVDACRSAGVPGKPVEWNRMILRMRKARKLPKLQGPKTISIRREDTDDYDFASEIAWENLHEKHSGLSLDDILSDPDIAQEFDCVARRFAPGFSPFQYRWAALKIRKYAMKDKARAKVLFEDHRLPTRYHDVNKISKFFDRQVAGAYVLRSESATPLYAGESKNLGKRLRCHTENGNWKFYHFAIFELDAIIRPLSISNGSRNTDGPALKFALIEKFQPKCNLPRNERSRS